jgi:hypothetical protein
VRRGLNDRDIAEATRKGGRREARHQRQDPQIPTGGPFKPPASMLDRPFLCQLPKDQQTPHKRRCFWNLKPPATTGTTVTPASLWLGYLRYRSANQSGLRRRMIEDMTVRNLSPATQRSYVHAVAKFSRYFGRSPERLDLEDVRAFQVHLVANGISWPALIRRFARCGSSTASASGRPRSRNACLTPASRAGVARPVGLVSAVARNRHGDFNQKR